MKFLITLFCLLFLSGWLFSQNKKIDSLLAEYEKLLQAGETKMANRVLMTADVEAKTTTTVNAIRYFQRALTIAESYQNTQLIADCYGIIGRLYSEQGLYFQSLDYMVKAYKIYKNIGYEDSLGYLYLDIGNAYYAQGLTDIPVRYYLKAYQVHINRQDYWGMATSLNNIALVHQRQMQWDSAAYYYQQALEVRRKTPYAYLIAHSYYYLGRLHYLKKEYPEALHYLTEGEKIALREVDRLRRQKDSMNVHEYTYGWITTVETIFNLYHTIAEIYRESQKNDSAIMYYLSAVKYYDENPQLLVNIGIKLHIKIAEMYRLMGKLSQAEQFARDAIALSDSNERVDLKNESLLLLSEILARQGKKTEALDYLQEYIRKKHDVDFNKQLNKIADFQAILGDYENRIFMQQTEQEIRLKNTQNFILWLAFIFTGILAFIIYRSYRVKTKINRELQEALAQVKTLSGLLPICAACKKIRDDAGYWHQIEAYISTHSEAEFTHSICQECQRKLYPELFKKESDADPN